VRIRRFELRNLTAFLAELGIADVPKVSFSALESYQRHQYHHRKADGTPLSFRTQSHRLVAVKLLFSWLVRQGRLGFDPAAAIELPKVERRLPEATLSAEEAEAVLAGPDVTTPLGLRDRVLLEVFYSSALRRSELIRLRLADIDGARGTVFVRQGKGARDRYVPIGERAVAWARRYVEEVRPRLAKYPDAGVLFLSASGEPMCAEWLTRTVRAYVKAGAPAKKGSCHLLGTQRPPSCSTVGPTCATWLNTWDMRTLNRPRSTLAFRSKNSEPCTGPRTRPGSNPPSFGTKRAPARSGASPLRLATRPRVTRVRVR
jgi:integrase/recombinase XerD